MKLEELLPKLRAGERGRLPEWGEGDYIKKANYCIWRFAGGEPHLYLCDSGNMLRDDWELVPRPVGMFDFIEALKRRRAGKTVESPSCGIKLSSCGGFTLTTGRFTGVLDIVDATDWREAEVPK